MLDLNLDNLWQAGMMKQDKANVSGGAKSCVDERFDDAELFGCDQKLWMMHSVVQWCSGFKHG